MSPGPAKKSEDAFSPPIYHGDQDVDRLPDAGPPLKTKPDAANRGQRARREGSGVVSGSGAGAGGTEGINEDYDSDPVGGGGPGSMPTLRKSE